jgi:hypothetical protein
MKACSKFELAQAAGVSVETLRRWLKNDKSFFEAHSVSPKAKVLPPIVVKYICEKYCIDLPP